MPLVVCLAVPGVLPFELAVACEVFGSDRRDLTPEWYDFELAAITPGLVRTSIGLQLHVSAGLEALERADTIVVPAWDCDMTGLEPAVAALREASERGTRIVALCTGAFLLAAAGLLDDRPATTHWMHADELARRYPAVKVDPNVLYVDDGDVLTSAGTAAGIDLCLHVVRSDLGTEVANAVARRMVVPPHRDGGQAQFVDRPLPLAPGDAELAGTLAFMLDHLNEPLSVERLAAHAHMSPRTFARRFAAVTGSTPHQWLVHQRLLLARRLLESTDAPVDRVARRAGFGSAASLRHHFSRALDVSPQRYRQTFRAAAS